MDTNGQNTDLNNQKQSASPNQGEGQKQDFSKNQQVESSQNQMGSNPQSISTNPPQQGKSVKPSDNVNQSVNQKASEGQNIQSGQVSPAQKPDSSAKPTNPTPLQPAKKPGQVAQQQNRQLGNGSLNNQAQGKGQEQQGQTTSQTTKGNLSTDADKQQQGGMAGESGGVKTPVASKPVKPPVGSPGVNNNISKQPGGLSTQKGSNKNQTEKKGTSEVGNGYPAVSQSVKPSVQAQGQGQKPQPTQKPQTQQPTQQGVSQPSTLSQQKQQNVQPTQQTQGTTPSQQQTKSQAQIQTGQANGQTQNLATSKPTQPKQPETIPSAKADDDLRKTHEPVIILPDRLEMGQVVNVKVKVGMIPHVMETPHHIQSIELFAGNNSLGKVELDPSKNSSAEADFQVALNSGMQLKAVAYCNVHGKWESSTSV